MEQTEKMKLAVRVGARIARARQAAELTQEAVAERLGIGNEAVSRMERGVVMPTVERLYEFAELYGIGVDAFLIDASNRGKDQETAMGRLLNDLQPHDRGVVVEIVERIVAHLRR